MTDTYSLPPVIVTHDVPPALSAEGDNLLPIEIALYDDGDVTIGHHPAYVQLASSQLAILIGVLQATQQAWADHQGNGPATGARAAFAGSPMTDTYALPPVIVTHDVPSALSADGDDLSPIKIELYDDGDVMVGQDRDYIHLTPRQLDIMIGVLQATQQAWADHQGNSPATEPSAARAAFRGSPMTDTKPADGADETPRVIRRTIDAAGFVELEMYGNRVTIIQDGYEIWLTRKNAKALATALDGLLQPTETEPSA